MDIPTKKGRVQIDGRHVDIVCSKFGSTLFIFISELQKIGTLLEVTTDSVVNRPSSKFTFSVRTLLGKDDDLTHAVGRSVAGYIAGQTQRPGQLLLALGLRADPTPSTLFQLLTQLDSLSVWSEAAS